MTAGPSKDHEARREAQRDATQSPELRYDVLTGPGQSLQFSLSEILVVMVGVSLGLAASRWFPGPWLPLVLGVSVLVGWSKLYVDDWEPRWGMVAWAAGLGAYLGSAFSAVVLTK